MLYYEIGIELSGESNASIPISILDTNETIPALITTSPYMVEVDNITENRLDITWDFGSVTNPLLNNDTLLVLQYIGVVLDNDLPDVQILFTGTTFLSNFVVARVMANSTVVEPLLILEVISIAIQVSLPG